MGTTLLRGGKIVDGTGGQARDGHLLMDGDRIRALLGAGEALPAADSVIDATGCVVAPGFIDAHSHMDWSLPLDDHPYLLKCFLSQGVTTVVAGNCGFSPAPVEAETFTLLDSGSVLPFEKPLDYSWRSMGEFLDRIQERKPVLNLAQLVGHATIRIAAGMRRGAMKPDELKKCLAQAQQSLDEGACGLSFGLGYDPGIWSPKEEVEAFSAVAAKAKKPVAVHLRTYLRFSTAYSLLSSKPHNLLALQEMIDVARSTGVSLQLSHAVLFFRVTWPTIDRYLGMIEEGRRQGVDVMMDAIPYTALNGSVSTLLPLWFIASLPRGYKSRWARLRVNVEYNPLVFRRSGYDVKKQVRLMDAGVKGWEDLSGLPIGEIARKWGVSTMDAALRLCEASDGRAAILCQEAAGEPGNEKHLENILSHSVCLFGSDALIRSQGYPNAAAFGTFPKVLGYYARERKLFSVEDAVRRMTSASADRFGLKDRGRLEAGKAADIVVFDPQTISEAPSAGPETPGRPVGIRHVLLNGTHVVKDGAYVVGARAGRVLRV
jgi:N-acyl-D-amino-acid deacylase